MAPSVLGVSSWMATSTSTSTSATVAVSGIPAGGIIVQIKINFRSPYVSIDYYSYFVYPDGDVDYGYSNLLQGSCGRHSPWTGPYNSAHYVYLDGDVDYHGVNWNSCGNKSFLPNW